MSDSKPELPTTVSRSHFNALLISSTLAIALSFVVGYLIGMGSL